MGQEEIFRKLRDGILDFNQEAVVNAAKEVVQGHLSPLEAMSVLTNGIRDIGEMYARNEIWLMDMMCAADAMQAGMSVLLPHIPKDKVKSVGKVAIGTVQGDIHDVGKSMVATMLTVSGFEVHDIGKDVPMSKFAEQAQATNAEIVALSALMTTTKPMIKEVIDYFKALGLREKYKFMVGGAPVTGEYATQIGADGYAPDAVEACKVALDLVRKEGSGLA